MPPRYGPQIVGGSEALTREIATGLAERGWDVEVLTTRVISHLTWEDELPAGVSHEDGLAVRRFSTVHELSRRGLRAQYQVQDGVIPPVDDQWSWVSWRVRIPDLFHHLLRYGDSYDAVVFSPYMFWNATACMPAVPGNAVAMPCLHDESYARMEVMRPVLASPRSVWFLSEPEHELAHRLGPVADHHTVTGAGIHVPGSYDPDGFRARHGIRRPFVLYAGRREKDKGWGWLLDAYLEAVGTGLEGVDLVTFGHGEVDPPAEIADRVIDLGFVSEADRNDAFAAALAYVQPSRMESFSRTIMEAWLAGTPVLAIDGSAVVDWHCRRSGGGLVFADGEQLGRHIRALHSDPERAAGMADLGREYVLREYSWPVVLDRMEADLESLRRSVPARSGPPAPEAPPAPEGPVTPEDPVTPVAPEAAGSSAGGVLVLGSYPPIPRPAAPVTVDEVRRLWREGRTVTVASPRLSAAHLTIPVGGVLAGRRLRNARRHSGASDLVMVMEPGFPVPSQGRLRRYLSARMLAGALGEFGHVRLVMVGVVTPFPGSSRLTAAADEVVPADGGPGAAAVSPFGPAEVTVGQRPGWLVGRVARMVLGSRAPAVRARLGRIRRAAARRLRRSRGQS